MAQCCCGSNGVKLIYACSGAGNGRTEITPEIIEAVTDRIMNPVEQR